MIQISLSGAMETEATQRSGVGGGGGPEAETRRKATLPRNLAGGRERARAASSGDCAVSGAILFFFL